MLKARTAQEKKFVFNLIGKIPFVCYKVDDFVIKIIIVKNLDEVRDWEKFIKI